MAEGIDLVIFDCDGVLVDSEMLSAGVLMAMMAEAGLPITPEIFRSDFLGRSFSSAAGRVAERFGRPMPEDFQMNYRKRLLARMETELQAMTGIEIVLKAMRIPFCLATGSSPPRLELSLRVTGLHPYFEGRAYTASLVLNGKPAPDLYIYAAAQMGVASEKCLVIEDSEMGVRAAKAARMAVWHFTGGAHIKSGYRLPHGLTANRAVANMGELHQQFRERGLCS